MSNTGGWSGECGCRRPKQEWPVGVMKEVEYGTCWVHHETVSAEPIVVNASSSRDGAVLTHLRNSWG